MSALEIEAVGSVDQEMTEWNRPYREAFTDSLEAVAIIDRQGRYIWQNAAHQRLLGRDDASLLQRTAAQELGQGAHMAIQRGLTAEGVFHGQCRLRLGEREALVKVSALGVAGSQGRAGAVLILHRSDIAMPADYGQRFLSEASSAIASSLDYEETLRNLTRSLVPAFADRCSIFECDQAGRIRPVAGAHRDPRVDAILRECVGRCLPLGQRKHPIAIAVRQRRAQLVREVEQDWLEMIVEDPAKRAELEDTRPSSLIAVPLIASGQVRGALSLAIVGVERRYGEADLAVAEELGRRASLAIENARLFAAERSARADAEASQQRLEFLAEASNVLSASLDYLTTLRTVARLVVPRLADWCTVDMLNDDGSMTRVAVVHRDPKKVEWARQLHCRYPERDNEERGVSRVLRTGLSELYSHIDDAMLVGAAQDEAHLKLLREAATESAMIVPLVARGRTLGVISFITTSESNRRYRPEDLAFAEDIARRVAQAVDNARLYTQLQDALKVKEQALSQAEQAKHAAETANARKDHFLAVLSHELRTPLTPVLAAVTSMDGQALSDAMQWSLQMIRRNVEMEARLIDDLLDLTRIERGKLELILEPVDVHELLRRTVETCEPNVRAGSLTVSMELRAVNASVRADSGRLQQVFWNLLSNAVKFTPPGGWIIIRTSDEGENGVRVDVVDTGIGIESAVMPRLFDAFEQAEGSITRRYGGLGLGLTISRALVEAHGGKLTAVSAGEGRGTTFSVRLQAERMSARSRDAGPERLPKAGLRSLRILLVEDHADTIRVLSRLLRSQGHAVTTANTVADAVKAYGAGEFDLLISDIGLPDGTGIDVMREARRRRPVAGIAISGFGMEADVARSKQAGFSEHLVKPINFQRLEMLIGEMAYPGGGPECPRDSS